MICEIRVVTLILAKHVKKSDLLENDHDTVTCQDDFKSEGKPTGKGLKPSLSLTLTSAFSWRKGDFENVLDIYDGVLNPMGIENPTVNVKKA